MKVLETVTFTEPKCLEDREKITRKRPKKFSELVLQPRAYLRSTCRLQLGGRARVTRPMGLPVTTATSWVSGTYSELLVLLRALVDSKAMRFPGDQGARDMVRVSDAGAMDDVGEPAFRLEEATVQDLHEAIRAGRTTCVA